MKKNLSKTLSGTTLLLTLALTACGGDATPGNLAAYQQGSNKCSDQFLQEGQQLEVDVEMDLISFNDDAAHRAINEFGAKYKDVNCKIEVDGQSQMIDVNDFVSRANAELVQFREQHPYSPTNSAGPSFPSAPMPVPLPTPAETNSHDSTSQSLRHVITLKIYDESAFNPPYEQGRSSMIIQQGRLVPYSELDFQADYCSIMYVDHDPRISAGSQVNLNPSITTATEASYVAETYSFVLDCKRRMGSTAGLTLEGINLILGSLATASITQ